MEVKSPGPLYCACRILPGRSLFQAIATTVRYYKPKNAGSKYCQYIGKWFPMSNILLQNKTTFLHAGQWVSADLLTCGWPDSWGDVGRCQRRDTFIILGIACLNGTQVTVASCSETSREVKGIHSLSFNFTKHWFTHRFKLPINLCFTHLNKQQQCIWFFTCFFVIITASTSQMDTCTLMKNCFSK